MSWSKLDDPDIATEVLTRLIEGESLVEICKDPRMPSRRAVYRRAASDDAFGVRYSRAQDLRKYQYFDEIIEIADNGSGDVRRDALRVDSRKWALARMDPKFRDKVQTELSGTVGIRHEEALKELE